METLGEHAGRLPAARDYEKLFFVSDRSQYEREQNKQGLFYFFF